jgi:two-component system phosphate regulon sensor histidine kinase PhoR
MRKKISVKIILYFTFLIAAMTMFLLVFFADMIRDNHLDMIRNDMDEKARFVELMLKKDIESADKHNPAALDQAVKNISDIIKLRITLIDKSGKVSAESHVKQKEDMDNHNHRLEISGAREYKTANSTRYSSTLKSDMMYYAISSGDHVIRLAKPLHEIKESISKTRSIISITGLSVLSLSILIIIAISRQITRPIKESISFAESFASGDYSRRILNYSNDEIGALQKTLNRLADIIVEKIGSLCLEQNKLIVTIETITDGIAFISNEKEIIISNTAFTSLTGYEGTAKNRLYYEVIRNSTVNERITQCLAAGRPDTFQQKMSHNRYCEVFLNPVNDSSSFRGLVIILHDMSESKRLEEMKTDLISSMSHEFKTPIAILKGYLETIRETINDRETSLSLIDKALRNVDRQDSLVNDILKLNRLETGRDFNEDEIDAAAIIRDCLGILAAKAEQKNIKITETLTENVTGSGNRFLAEEVFYNIIDNAINYNNLDGHITITSESSGRGTVIKIKDTGIGIPEAAIDRIFERFYRVDKSRSRSTGGTGLGLSIVKHAAELLNWNIRVSSGRDGTTFSVTIPIPS